MNTPKPASASCGSSLQHAERPLPQIIVRLSPGSTPVSRLLPGKRTAVLQARPANAVSVADLEQWLQSRGRYPTSGSCGRTPARAGSRLGADLDPNTQHSARCLQAVSRTGSAAQQAAKPILDAAEASEMIPAEIKRRFLPLARYVTMRLQRFGSEPSRAALHVRSPAGTTLSLGRISWMRGLR